MDYALRASFRLFKFIPDEFVGPRKSARSNSIQSNLSHATGVMLAIRTVTFGGLYFNTWALYSADSKEIPRPIATWFLNGLLSAQFHNYFTFCCSKSTG
jgi:hypothetical protein